MRESLRLQVQPPKQARKLTTAKNFFLHLNLAANLAVSHLQLKIILVSSSCDQDLYTLFTQIISLVLLF